MSTIKTSGLALIEQAEQSLAPVFTSFEEIGLFNQEKVLTAFKEEKVGTHHFNTSTGYGYGDLGRETLERVFARAFGAEAALVRQQIVSGTHAINLGLSGLLRPGDELIFATSLSYDTSAPSGYRRKCSGIFRIMGSRSSHPLAGGIDRQNAFRIISNRTLMVAFQRLGWRRDRRSFTTQKLSAGLCRRSASTGCPLFWDVVMEWRRKSSLWRWGPI